LLLYRFLYLLSELLIWVSDILMYAFQMELNKYPHFYLAEDGRLFHGSALPGVPESAIRHTHPSWLRWGCSGLPLPTVYGPRLGQVQG
jgi:hypothetical protein